MRPMWYVPLMSPSGQVLKQAYVRAADTFGARLEAQTLFTEDGKPAPTLDVEVPFAQQLSETYVAAMSIQETKGTH